MSIGDKRLWPDLSLWLSMIGLGDGDEIKRAVRVGLLRKSLSDEDFLKRLSSWSAKRAGQRRAYHQEKSWNWRGTTPDMRDDEYWYERAKLTPRRTQ